jgi:hypothetical protein
VVLATVELTNSPTRPALALSLVVVPTMLEALMLPQDGAVDEPVEVNTCPLVDPVGSISCGGNLVVMRHPLLID